MKKLSLVENETPALPIPCLLQDSDFISRSFHVLVSVEWFKKKKKVCEEASVTHWFCGQEPAISKEVCNSPAPCSV